MNFLLLLAGVIVTAWVITLVERYQDRPRRKYIPDSQLRLARTNTHLRKVDNG